MKLSDIARPPIQLHDTEGAEHSICPFHNGLIRETGDVEGRVFFCPIGKMYFRYSAKWQSGFNGPLNYRFERAI